ncbi:MAG: MgtC/SapB family protein [Actinomycetota bacterium]
MIGTWAVAARILVAAGLGAAVGLERELRERAAGLRTHMLVAMGSCLFTLVSAFGFPEFTSASANLAARPDPTRIASQIVVGIGFIGGGAILRHGATIRGLTTAATLWVTAAIGLAAGLGFYPAAVITTAVAVFTLSGLRPIEALINRLVRREEKETREP